MEASSVTKMRDNGDRISSLPDEVLCHILSFLPTKYSVRTRLLSYRWNHLFAYVPVLDLNFCSYHPRASHKRFVDFVNWVLSLYNVPQMIKFRIDWETSTSQKYRDILICWISSAISCNVQELDITVYPKENLKFPYELFFCNTLSSLKVQGWFYLKLPSSALLPCLKILHLAFVKFDSSTKRILSACPVLEDLYLRRCIFKDVLNLSNPTLKKLWIEECHDYVLILNAPSLLQFDFLSSRINGIISEIESTLLVTACIRPESYASQNSKKLKVTMKFVNVVSHAKHLYLSSSSLEAFQVSYEELPKFCNLKRLEIAHASSIVLELLPYLLDKSSHMEVLIFATGFSKEKSNATGLIGFRNVPSCVSLNLKVIVFKGFLATENERKLVEYFLKNAKVLDKMIIQVHRMSMEEKDAFSKKLLTFSKFSSDCQIVIKESCQ